MSHGDMGQTSEWRIAVRGEQRGPFTLDQVRAMIAEGRLPADTLAWRPGMANWAPMASVPELAAAAGRGPTPAATPGPAGPTHAGATGSMPSAAALAARPNEFLEFVAFRKMLTPLLIKLLFWAGIAACALAGLTELVGAFRTGDVHLFFIAFGTLVVCPVVLRVWCELMILLFGIHETLQEIKNEHNAEDNCR